MAANNEIGTIQPIKQIAELAHSVGAKFHTDAVQAVGHMHIDVQEMGIDMLSLSGHKFRGPRGTGVLYVKKGITLEPLVYGGGQSAVWFPDPRTRRLHRSGSSDEGGR